MENNGKYSGHFSKKLRAGKRRTYFFDVRSTKQGDFFLTITESKKKFDSDGYDSHKIFLYKEDFKKFVEALNETVDYIKTELMPDYDYESDRPARTNHTSTISEDTPNSSGSNDDFSSENANQAPPQISDDEEINWN